MTDAPLAGRRILVVEDEYYLAEELRDALVEAGAEVLGPVGRLAPALALAKGGEPIDAALLDLNLGGTEVFPLADALIARGVPVVFATGYDAAAVPRPYRFRPA